MNCYCCEYEMDNSIKCPNCAFVYPRVLGDKEEYEKIIRPLAVEYRKKNNIITKSEKTLIQHYEEMAKPGTVVSFGRYEQDKTRLFGRHEKKPISWNVLSVEREKALLISQQGLAMLPFHNKKEAITWESCSLRQWLNHDFLKEAFTEEEQEAIILSTVKAEKNPEYNTKAGNDTQDKVFLLSIQEVNRYYSLDKERKKTATDFVKEKGAYVAGNNGSWWWLRTPGRTEDVAANVRPDGKIHTFGHLVNHEEAVVCPAIWVDMEKDCTLRKEL